MTMDSQEAEASKSIPAGAKTSSEIASPPPKLDMKQDSAKQAYEHGHQPNEEQEKSTDYTNQRGQGWHQPRPRTRGAKKVKRL